MMYRPEVLMKLMVLMQEIVLSVMVVVGLFDFEKLQ
jgi:hypothetical protein